MNDVATEDKQDGVVNDVATAGKKAVRAFAALAGIGPWQPCSHDCTATAAAGLGRIEASAAQLGLFLWAHDVVAHKAAGPFTVGGREFREAGELAGQTVEIVRGFLEKRKLLDWYPTLPETGRSDDELDELERQIGEATQQLSQLTGELTQDVLKTVPYLKAGVLLDEHDELRVQSEGEFAGRLLVIDFYLAELLDEIDSPKNAASVRATSFDERGKRWLEDGESTTPSGCRAVLAGVWARIKAKRERERQEEEERAERHRKVPVPSLHNVTAAVVFGLGRRLDTPTLRGTAAGIVACAPSAWAQLSEASGDTAGVLAAWLATQVHHQWVAGGFDLADRVEVVASKASLETMGLGGDRPEDEIEAALSLLASVRLMAGDDDQQPGAGRLVLDYFKADKKAPTAKGGRPSAVYVVTVGWPLMPTRLEALAAVRGFTVPRELAWYGPVLEPSWAMLTGNKRTARTQRLAFAVGAGQWLVSRREEYAELGGVRLDTLRPFLQSMGLYHRSHASLADDVAEQWRATPQPKLPGFGPKGPLLVPTKVDGVYKLGPDYKAQEALVIRNAGVTAKAKTRQRLRKP